MTIFMIQESLTQFTSHLYNRNTYINLQNIYSTYAEKEELLKKDENIIYVYQKNIMISTNTSDKEKQFYNYNLDQEEIILPKLSDTEEQDPNISPPPSDNQETILFTNSLFTLGDLEK